MPAAANADAIKLKLTLIASDQESTYVSVIKPFIDAVNGDGKGIVQIDGYPGGALSHDPLEQVGLLKSGAADIAFVVPGLTPDVFPDDGVFDLPGLFDTTAEASLTYARIVATQPLKGYQDFYVIGAFASEPQTIDSRLPINSLADLRGLRISFNNAQSANAFRALGAVPVDMPLPSVAEAIGKGTLDAAATPLVPALQFGVTKVTTYHYLLDAAVSPLLLIMNRKTFDALPQAAKDIIAKYSGDWVVQRYIAMNTSAAADVLKQLRANPARKVIVPSTADQATAHAAFAKVADAWQASDPRYPALLAAVKSEVMTLREAHP